VDAVGYEINNASQYGKVNEKQTFPCLHQVPNCWPVVYTHASGAKRPNATNYIILTDVTARLNLEESH